MSDRPADQQLPADSAHEAPRAIPGASMSTNDSTVEMVVPFKDRDFRAVARKSPPKSMPVSTLRREKPAAPSVCAAPTPAFPDPVVPVPSGQEAAIAAVHVWTPPVPGAPVPVSPAPEDPMAGTPLKETPIQLPTVEVAPIADFQVQPPSVQEALGQAAPVWAQPVAVAQIRRTAVQVCSAQETPIPETTIPETLAEPAPVAVVPVEEIPVPSTPVEETPAQDAPGRALPVPAAPIQEIAVQVPPTQEVPIHTTPIQESQVSPARFQAAPVAPAQAPRVPVAPIQETALPVPPAQEVLITVAPVHEVPRHVAPSESVPAAPTVSETEVHVQIRRTTPTAVVAPAPAEVIAEAAPMLTIDEPTPAESALPAVQNGFGTLSLNEYVLKAVVDGGYDQPTPIQEEVIPLVLAGRDVLAQSQTGSGKTAAFALPILSQIDTGKHAPREPQVLVLAPTRELAIQVSNSFATYGTFLPGFTVTTIYGGQSYDSQFRQLKRGVHVVVGTPGRLIDHIKRGTLDLSGLRCLVLDEADEMLNMGFLDDVRFVLEQIPAERQIALFSATLPAPICTIAEEYLHEPARVTIKQKTMTADSIRQRALFVAPRDKIDALKRILEAEETDGVIIFTKTREATVTVADQLKREGLATVALNGDMPQPVRERTIEQLKAGELDILVATDVAARGLDVTRVSHVINYDAPNDNDSYVHRVGRTGRAGRTGEAIIFLNMSQRGRLRQIERATRQTIEVIDLPTTDDINATRVKRFVQRIAEAAADQDLAVFEKMIERFAKESETPMLRIAAALAHLGQQGRPFFVKELRRSKRDRQDLDRSDSRFNNGDRNSRSDRGDRRSRPGDQSSGPVEAGMDRYRIAVGWQDGVKPGNIVGAVANEGGIDGEAIGAIRIYSTYSTIDLPEGMPAHVRQTLQTTRVAGRPLQLRPYTEEPQSSERRAGQLSDKPRERRPFVDQRSASGAGKPGKRPFNKKPHSGSKPGHKAAKDNQRSKRRGTA